MSDSSSASGSRRGVSESFEALNHFEVAESRRPYEGVLSTVRVDTLRAHDGAEFQREVVEHIDAVAVVPVTADGEIVLVRHYRHPFRRVMLEIPAGVCDVHGEEAASTARRELAEEVALEGEQLTLLTTFHNSAGWTDEQTSIFLGCPVRPVDRPDGFVLTDEEASMEVVRMPLEEAVAAIHRGELTDAKTIIGLLLAVDRL